MIIEHQPGKSTIPQRYIVNRWTAARVRTFGAYLSCGHTVYIAEPTLEAALSSDNHLPCPVCEQQDELAELAH